MALHTLSTLSAYNIQVTKKPPRFQIRCTGFPPGGSQLRRAQLQVSVQLAINIIHDRQRMDATPAFPCTLAHVVGLASSTRVIAVTYRDQSRISARIRARPSSVSE